MKRIACLLIACLPLAAAAQNNLVYLEFSGGNGEAVTVNVLNPIQFEVLEAPSLAGQFFVFDGVGDFLQNDSPSGFGTLSYTINDGAPLLFNELNTGTAINSVTADDFYIYNNVASDSTLQLGDVLTLGTGAITTSFAIGMSPPTNGYFPVFLMDAAGNEIVTGVIPEPSTYAFAMGLGLIGFIIARKKLVRS